jgi:hypothetical protein
MLDGIDWRAVFGSSLSYGDFLQQHGTDEQRRRWAAVDERVRLTPEQSALLGGFARDMRVFCLAGAWCGDCANQVPMLRRIAEASPRVELRVGDRDMDPDLRDALAVNGGHRVPVVVFLSEDWKVCAVVGDRVVAFYRQMAADRLGPACPTGILPPGDALLAEAMEEWVTEFERVQLMLRLTGRLRELHGD